MEIPIKRGLRKDGLTSRSSRRRFVARFWAFRYASPKTAPPTARLNSGVMRHRCDSLAIESLANLIPEHLLEQSGKVFYSGRKAFSNTAPIYLLGLNPGGTPGSDTIRDHTDMVLNKLPDDWSAYRDESWRGRPPGTRGMAPRVLHVLTRLGFNPGTVPASNLVFVRSRREADIERSEMQALADACWPFHAKAIEELEPRAIICFGNTVSNYVRKRLNANSLRAEFVEQNERKWRSRAFTASSGITIIAATHPSIADWCAPKTDISPLLQQVLL